MRSLEYKGFKIEVRYDEYPEDPRTWNNIGTIYTNMRNIDPDGHKIDELMDEEGELDLDGYIWIKVYAYIHSGIVLSTSGRGQFSDPWDSGLFGIIAVRKDDPDIKGMMEETVLNYLAEEIRVYSAYLEGDVLMYTIYDGTDMVDRGDGYYDEDEDSVMEEAKQTVDILAARKEAV